MRITKPLVVLDLETTGTWIDKDRIIEAAFIRIEPDGKETVLESRINPCMPIPPVVTELTGISDADVKNAPTFSLFAPKVLTILKDADLGGFNVERFDIPLLIRELSDNGLTLDMTGRQIYDAQKVYHFHEKRDLSAAYAFYCKKDLKDAHSALADTKATLDILNEQINRYGQGEQNVDLLKAFDYKVTREYFDQERKFRWWNGDLYMTFGKYAKKEPLRLIAQKDPGYLNWILEKDFSDDVKGMIADVLNGRHPKPQ